MKNDDGRTIRVKWEGVFTFDDPVTMPDPMLLADELSQIVVDRVGGEGKSAYLHPGMKVAVSRAQPPKAKTSRQK